MSNNFIETDSDLFGLDLPTVEPDGSLSAPETSASVTVGDKITDFVHQNAVVSYSVIGFVCLLLLVFLILLIKRIIRKSKNPMLEYTRQQIKRGKQQAYVSSSNKLETPDNLMECIRAFLDRTK